MGLLLQVFANLDGTLKGLTYKVTTKGTKTLRITAAGKKETLLGITSFDFDSQYSRAIDIWAEFRGLQLNDEQVKELLETKEAFVKKYKLK